MGVGGPDSLFQQVMTPSCITRGRREEEEVGEKREGEDLTTESITTLDIPSLPSPLMQQSRNWPTRHERRNVIGGGSFTGWVMDQSWR